MSTRRPPGNSLFTKSNYLLSYNALSFCLWTTITLRALLLLPFVAPEGRVYGVYDAIFSPLLTTTQSLALLEIIHAVLGVVRASPMTTAMQVASRLVVVWGVLAAFPEIVAGREIIGIRTRSTGKAGAWAFVGCVMAWGPTEMVRYGFFVAQLWTGRVPELLTWLRYNTFFVLYPVGIASECWLMYLAQTPASTVSSSYVWLLRLVLLIYVPGSYILYTHMMAQRRRVMKGKARSR